MDQTLGKCLVCGQDREWHHEHLPHHKFSEDGSLEKADKVDKQEPQERTITAHRTGDPALRAVLVSKGIITSQELRQMDEVLGTGQIVTLPEIDEVKAKIYNSGKESYGS